MNTLLDEALFLKIFYAILCGSIIGVERQIRGKPVGIRTSILICFGTMLFIMMGTQICEGKDAARILGQIVTGVGFLGAGVIMTKEGLVSGVTSASAIWVLAGIGAAIGFGYYELAVIVSLVVLGVLIGVQHLENVFKWLQKGVHKHIKGE